MNKLMVLDGDFGAELRRHFQKAADFGDTFTLHALNVDRMAVFRTHLAYLRAGAQIIRINTSQVSMDSVVENFNESPDQDILYSSLIQRAVILAKQAITRYYEEKGEDMYSVDHLHRPLIAGVCGSYVPSILHELEKTQTTTESYLMSVPFLQRLHDQHVEELMKAGVDLLAFESIRTENEVKAIINVLNKYSKTRAWITLYCPQDAKLIDGTDFAEMATYCNALLPRQLMAIGVECDLPETMIPVIRELQNSLSNKIPYMMFANKSLISTTEDTASSSTGQQYDYVQQCWDAGVRFIGGGTNTVAEDIQKIREQVDSFCASTGQFLASAKQCSYQNEENLSKL